MVEINIWLVLIRYHTFIDIEWFPKRMCVYNSNGWNQLLVNILLYIYIYIYEKKLQRRVSTHSIERRFDNLFLLTSM